MTLAVNHVHLKTRDPKRTMQFYIDNFGATFVAEIGTRGYRVNLHGLTLNITTIVDGQTREQHHGIEHIALDTDDYLRLADPKVCPVATGDNGPNAGTQ